MAERDLAETIARVRDLVTAYEAERADNYAGKSDRCHAWDALCEYLLEGKFEDGPLLALCTAAEELREATETVDRCWDVMEIPASRASQPLWDYVEHWIQSTVDAEGDAQRKHEECEALRIERDALRQALVGMLQSQDCTWEERNEGHDWAQACAAARAALASRRGGER